MNKKIPTKTVIIAIASAVAVFLLAVIAAIKLYPAQEITAPFDLSFKEPLETASVPAGSNDTAKDKLLKFSSEQDFKDYLEKSDRSESSSIMMFGRTLPSPGLGRGGLAANDIAISESSPKMAVPLDASSGGQMPIIPGRTSETNVQVLGIDEPDTVKADRGIIYFSQPRNFFRPVLPPVSMPIMNDRYAPVIDKKPVTGQKTNSVSSVVNSMPSVLYPPEQKNGKTEIIKAFPPENMEIASEIDRNGDLLFYKNTLIVFSENENFNQTTGISDRTGKIFGYDVSNPGEPKEKWTVEIKDGNELVGARLYKDTVYLTERSYIKADHPCPVEPFIVGGEPVRLECDQIYHPDRNIPVDLTYNLLSFDAESGAAKETVSFVGSSSSSVLYMSPNAIYLTYEYPGDFIKMFSDFLIPNGDIVPSSISEKIRKIQDYDLSDAAKMAELEDALRRFTQGLSSDEMMRIQNELTNRLDKFSKDHGRDLENTGIVKIDVPSLKVLSTGQVPGHPLNQFSLDEYRNNLRVATTYSGNFGWIGGIVRGGNNNGASDVYVLNDNLDRVGSVLDLGKGERIYSVRFLEDKGYVVTFKQIDPFFVLDLSDPKNPELKGELKIPGYSSYLHPLEENAILGIGEENGQVKLTLFDVSSPSSPKELNTYKLDEYWSEVNNNHHAFLLDKQRRVFFLPGGKGGYVFSYQDNELKLVKAIDETGVKRAVYMNDYLYVVAEDKIMVFDENEWERVRELDL